MTKTIQREILIPQPREEVWRAITDSATLAEWMFPNDFEPRVGHPFTFRVPPNPKVNFDGLVVRCEVLECEPPIGDVGGRLAFSWSAGGPVENTRVSFRLEADGDGTRVHFEHSGFDVSQPFGEHAFQGAEYGWAKMFKQLVAVVAGLAKRVDVASRLICASTSMIYEAFATAHAMQSWLPPEGMTGTMLAFEFREGGGYRMRLTYNEPEHASGKTSGDADEVEVRFVKLVPHERIEQAVIFESDDPAFAGEMRIIWVFESKQDGTLVTVRCEDVPTGIRPEDHQAGLTSTLINLAAFVEKDA